MFMYRLKTRKILLVERSLESVEVLSLAGRNGDITVPISHSTWVEAVVISFAGLF